MGGCSARRGKGGRRAAITSGFGHLRLTVRRHRSLARMLVALAVMGGVVMVAPKAAQACSCASSGPSVRQSYDTSSVVIYGRVIDRRVTIADPFNTSVSFTVAVDKVIKGAAGAEVVLTSGAASLCGRTNLPSGPFALLVGSPNPDGSYSIGSCALDVVPVEQVEALLGNLPDRDGRSPPSALVRADLGDVSLVSMDTTGRVVGYGRDSDVGYSLTPCPGGAKVMAMDWRSPLVAFKPGQLPVQIQVIDIATLAVESRRALYLPEMPPPGFEDIVQSGLRCLDAAGQRSALTVFRTQHAPQPAPQPAPTLVGYETVLERGGLIESTIPGFAIVGYDAGRNRLVGYTSESPQVRGSPFDTIAFQRAVAVDIDTATATALLDLAPGQAEGRLAFSPGFDRVVIAGSSSGDPRDVDLLHIVELATGSTSTIALPEPRRNAGVSWPQGERILLSWMTGTGSPATYRTELWYTGGVLNGSTDQTGVRLVANSFWSISYEPFQNFVRISPVPAAADVKMVLTRAYISQILPLERSPLTYIKLTDLPAVPITAAPSFTG